MDDHGILEAIERSESKVRRESERKHKEADAWENEQLARYERTRNALGPESSPVVEEHDRKPAKKRKPSTKPRVRRKHLSPASADQLAKRRDNVERLIKEHDQRMSLGEICRALNLTESKAKLALEGLLKDGRIESTGSGSATRYLPAQGVGRPSRQAPTQGSLEERIVIVLEDRHRATPEELAQALRAPLHEIREACGRLQGETRIEMRQFNGRWSYVLAVRV